MGIFSSILGTKALKKGNLRATEANTAAYNQASAMYAPYKQAGEKSLQYYNDAIGIGDSQAAIKNFENSPLYQLQFGNALKSGQQGVAAMGNAAGMRNSGATLKALQDNAQQTTNNYFQQYMNPLASGANTGLGVTNTLADLRMGEGQNKANYFNNKAQIKAGQYAGFDGLLETGLSLAGMGMGGIGGFGAGSGGFGMKLGQKARELSGYAGSMY